MTLDCNSDMKIILSNPANIVCGNKFEINFEYDFFTNISINLHDNYVNFQKTGFNADPYMKNIISSIHYDDESNVIFTDYNIDEIDDFIKMYDQNKLNIARTMVSEYDPSLFSNKDIKYTNTIKWRKAQINNQWYQYGYNYNNEEIIEISSKTKTIITWVVILIVLFLMLSYCFVAQCRFYSKN